MENFIKEFGHLFGIKAQVAFIKMVMVCEHVANLLLHGLANKEFTLEFIVAHFETHSPYNLTEHTWQGEYHSVFFQFRFLRIC